MGPLYGELRRGFFINRSNLIPSTSPSTGRLSPLGPHAGAGYNKPKASPVFSPSSLDMTPSTTLWKSNGAHEYLIIYEGKTWEESQRICASHGAFLVILDTPEEEAFLRKTENLHEYWIGLRRESIHNPWRYQNGTVFDNRFQIGNRLGLCAYWNLYGTSSTTCDNIRPCICRRASQKLE